MNTALIIVDVQKDFLPGGALGVPDGHRATILLELLMDDVDVIVFTADWHPEDHVSFTEPGFRPSYTDMDWPQHCVQDTEGAEIDKDLWDAAIETDKPIVLVHKGMNKSYEAYSGFDGRVERAWNINIDPLGGTLAQTLNALSIRHIKIGGLALDYCVKATAIDARSHYGDTTVYLNATRPVSYLTGAKAVADLCSNGVRLDAREY